MNALTSRLGLLLLITGSLFNTPVAAAENSSALWLSIVKNGELELADADDRSDWLYTLQGEYRAFDALEGARQLLGKTGVGYRLPGGFAVWLRYDYLHTEFPELGTLNENRLQQMVNWTGAGPKTTTIKLRGILEQRWVQDRDGVGVRLRLQARIDWPMNAVDGANWVAWVEPFYDLRSLSWVDTGWNQNRAFIGANLPLSPGKRIEVGYMNQWVNTLDNSQLISHTLWAQFRF